MTYRYNQCLLISVLMVVLLPFGGNMILMLWIVYLMCLFLTSFEFCLYFDVLCCTFCQIDVLFPSMAWCTIVSWWNKRFPWKNFQMHCCHFLFIYTKTQYKSKSLCIRKSCRNCFTPETFNRSHKIFFMEEVSTWYF